MVGLNLIQLVPLLEEKRHRRKEGGQCYEDEDRDQVLHEPRTASNKDAFVAQTLF